MKKKILLTGATGTMGMAAMREFAQRTSRPDIVVFARDSKKNRRKLAPFLRLSGVEAVWGDLRDAEKVKGALKGCSMALHVGGMVSPAADYVPQLTMEVNTGAMQNIIDAIKALPDPAGCALVYIGSVAQYGHKEPPHHWVSASDLLQPSLFDHYALSKVKAERLMAESGLPRWASLRLGSILSADLLMKGTDPITFHVPLRGVLEWTTDGDCGRLLANIAQAELPDSFWQRFYNIGSGNTFRLVYHDFESRLLSAIGCPPPEKIFEADWFATSNFHGAWFRDSDLLDNLLHFRGKDTCDEHFRRMRSTLPWYFRLTPLAPAFLIKAFMKRIAAKRPFGPLAWLADSAPELPDSPGKRHAEARVKAFFGSRHQHDLISDWAHRRPTKLSVVTPAHDTHGTLEAATTGMSVWSDKPEERIEAADLQAIAAKLGGRLMSWPGGKLDSPAEWSCRCGHRFSMRPASLIRGGHWCQQCLEEQGGSHTTSR